MMSNITSSQALLFAKNFTTNTKGSDAWKSTLEPLLDLFVTTTKVCPEDLGEFENIFHIVSQSLRHDPDGFVQLLKFHRLIKDGNGIKWLYYLCLIVMKIENPHLYEQVLEWSWEYPKDLLNLHRLTNMYNPIDSTSQESVLMNTSVNRTKGSLGAKTRAFGLHNGVNFINPSVNLQFEIVLYTREVLKVFKNLLTLGSTDQVNPMFLKYMSYETGLWALESKLIWTHLENLIKQDTDFINLLSLSDELPTTLGSELRDLLLKSHQAGGNIFTNKTRRLIKKCFNSHVNLLDNLFKGVHQDGSPFGSTEEGEEHEVNLICSQIKRSATLAYGRFEKTVRAYPRKTVSPETKEDVEEKTVPEPTQVDLVKDYLSKGYAKYLEMLKTGKAVVKTTGLDASQEVWQFFMSSGSFDQSIESKLQELTTKLKESLEQVAGAEMFKELASKFSLVLDISGSMQGTPIQTGLLYMLLMTKVFGINRLYYFESVLRIVDLVESDLQGTMCGLVKKIYKQTSGSTELESVFTHFRTNNVRDKNVIIITDGDCDPRSRSFLGSSSANPFHSAPKSSHGLKYIVVNVKETKMNFPYLGMDPDVCYVSGNNPKTLGGLFKALIKSLGENIPLTPSLVLKCSLDLDVLTHSFVVGNFSKIFDSEEISRIHQVFMKNRPPKKIQQTGLGLGQYDQSGNLNWYSDQDSNPDSDADDNEDIGIQIDTQTAINTVKVLGLKGSGGRL
jgi:hypothetical protein